MTTALIPAPQTALVDPERLALLAARATATMSAAQAASTLRAYESDWRHFCAWCGREGLPALPASPQAVALYLQALADGDTGEPPRRMATIQRRLAAIGHYHSAAGVEELPTRTGAVRQLMKGLRRRFGVAQTQKRAAVIDELRRMVDALPETLGGARDRALLLVGFAGAFRRSELVGLDADDLEFTPEGLIIHLRRSKTDQEGEGREVGIAYGSRPHTCPVRTLRAWLDGAGITDGPVFRPITRHGEVKARRLLAQDAGRIVQRAAAAAGLDAAQYAGHSLRSGFATSASQAGVDESTIASQTGHKSMKVLRRYIRRGGLFRNNASAQVGL